MTQLQPRQYIDFKLYLTRPPSGQGVQVALLPTAEVGETPSPVVVPAEAGPSPDMLPLIAGKACTLRKLVEFGKGLTNWLLPDEKSDDQTSIRDLFVDAMKRAGNTGGVRLRLIIADHALKQWPWEYIYFDPAGVGGPDSMSGFLALDPRISIVRHEPLPHPHPAPSATSSDVTDLRMVVAAASPKTQRALDVDKEVSDITTALQDFNVDGTKLTTIPLLDATPSDVAQALRGADSTFIFHFAGHGSTKATQRDVFSIGQTREEGVLYFLGDKVAKTEVEVRADDLAAKLQAAGVRMGVFGACYSGLRSERYPWDSVAGALAKRDIPAIIAMQYEVIDTHAIAFTKAFYGTLAAGLSLDEAMAAGRSAMYGVTSHQQDQPGFLEWGVPMLYSRLPDGKLFPERMARAGATAQQLRATIQHNVDTIAKGGKVVGIEAKFVHGTIDVTAKVGVVEGELIGIDAERASGDLHVTHDIKTVSGTVIGVRLDELDNGG